MDGGGPVSHRGQPPRAAYAADLRAFLHGQLARVALAGIGVLFAAGAAITAFIGSKVEDFSDRTGELTDRVTTRLEGTDRLIGDQAEDGARDLERLTEALRELQRRAAADPDIVQPPVPVPVKVDLRRSESASRPASTPQPQPRVPTAAPRPTPGPLDAFCAATKLCPSPRQED